MADLLTGIIRPLAVVTEQGPLAVGAGNRRKSRARSTGATGAHYVEGMPVPGSELSATEPTANQQYTPELAARRGDAISLANSRRGGLDRLQPLDEPREVAAELVGSGACLSFLF